MKALLGALVLVTCLFGCEPAPGTTTETARPPAEGSQEGAGAGSDLKLNPNYGK